MIHAIDPLIIKDENVKNGVGMAYRWLHRQTLHVEFFLQLK